MKTCPYCEEKLRNPMTFRCGSHYAFFSATKINRSKRCLQIENARLKRRVRELEEK